MEIAEWLSLARFVVTLGAMVLTVILAAGGALIGLVVRQSRVLGKIEQRLLVLDELASQLVGIVSRLDSNERQVYQDTRDLADLRRIVDQRCPSGATAGGELLPNVTVGGFDKVSGS